MLESHKLIGILNQFTNIIRAIIIDQVGKEPTEIEIQDILADLLNENADIANLDYDDVKSRYLDLQ